MSVTESKGQRICEQLTTFYVGKELFGIEVMKVQEVTGQQAVVPVPLAPQFVRGLVNLRGQIATAIGLNELFLQSSDPLERGQMSVVCRLDGNLVSLIVDAIGDVVEVECGEFEKTPDTVALSLRRFMKGIYKLNGAMLSVLDIEAICRELTTINESPTAVRL
jgi:purine-binding chemotaxis protein CheW